MAEVPPRTYGFSVEVPVCTNPAHGKSRVTRAGWYGKAPHRRQRWWCYPKNGDPPHRFSELLPREQAVADHCIECSTKIEPWEGQAGARYYLYMARVIAETLARLANGQSYRRAGAAARSNAQREIDPTLRRRRANRATHWRGRRRHERREPNLDGQLAANWVDVHARTILDPRLPTEWPERLVLDEKAFQIKSGDRIGLQFHILAAVGYVGGSPRVWRMQAYARKDQAAWEEFLTGLPGTPLVICADLDRAIRSACESVFPQDPAHPPPDLRYCEEHLHGALEGRLQQLPAGHPLLQALPGCLVSPQSWADFEDLTRLTQLGHVPGFRQNRLTTMDTFFRQFGPAVTAQVATRTARGPNSNGAVEGVLRDVKAMFQARSSSFGNRLRMDLLLGLITLGLNRRVDERAWADDIRAALEANAGRAPRQRPHDDRAGDLPSLFV